MSKKFLTIINTSEGHGAFSRHKRMCQALINEGHSVICIAPLGYKAEDINIISLRLNRLPNFGFIGLYLKILVTVIRNKAIFEKIDGIFTIREYDALCTILNPFFFGIPKVFLSRGDVISITKVNRSSYKTIYEKFKVFLLLRIYPIIQKFVLKYSQTVVIQAKFLLKLFKDRCGFEFNAIILTNDCPPHSPNRNLSIKEKKLDLISNEINLGFISPMYWECKGMRTIVQTIHELEKQLIKYKFHIIGDGPDLKRMKDEIGENNNVIWHGWLDDVSSILSYIDVVIIPSLYDSNPNLVLEMLMHDKLILASDIDAHKEMLIHNEFFFKTDDCKDLYNKILSLSTDLTYSKKLLSLIKERRSSLSFDWDSEFVKIMSDTTINRENI